MKLNRIFYCSMVCLATVILTGCEEQQLPTYDVNTHYVHFERMWNDRPVRFSFQTTPLENDYTVRIPVTLIGLAITEDKDYAVSVVTEDEPYKVGNVEYATTASPAVYDIDLAQTFSARVYSDELEITLHNVPDELEEEKCIVLRIENNENFFQGPQEYLISIIYVSNIISQPDWWDDDFSLIYLGPYSDIKYRHFIIATGVSDLSEMDNSEIDAYVREYVYYLRKQDAKGTPVLEKDGSKVLDTINFSA